MYPDTIVGEGLKVPNTECYSILYNWRHPPINTVILVYAVMENYFQSKNYIYHNGYRKTGELKRCPSGLPLPEKYWYTHPHIKAKIY